MGKIDYHKIIKYVVIIVIRSRIQKLVDIVYAREEKILLTF